MKRYEVDVVLPYCEMDYQYVEEAVNSILVQTPKTLIHLVQDGPVTRPFRPSHPDIRIYRTSNMGPYRIANSIVKHYMVSQILAIQDADDISYPNRLELQLTAIDNGYEQISAAMDQFAEPSYKGERHITEPLLVCGTKFTNVPLGRLVNCMRMVTKDMFVRVNGFPDIFCTGDLSFDNATQYLGIPTFYYNIPLGKRRLHGSSLTNRSDYVRTAPARQEALRYEKLMLKTIQASPTLATVRRFGALENASLLST